MARATFGRRAAAPAPATGVRETIPRAPVDAAPGSRSSAHGGRGNDSQGHDARGNDSQGHDEQRQHSPRHDAQGYDAQGYDARGYGAATVVRTSRSRGLLGTPAVLLALVVALLGGALDEVTGRGFGRIFSVFFVTGCVLAALLVRRKHLLAVVAAPPLLYAGLALAAGLARGLRSLRLQALELLTSLLVGAPTLVGATLLVLVVAVVRGVLRQ